MSITIFSNIFINDPIKLEILKISFSSFNQANISQWLLNIRGKYKLKAIQYLKKNISQEVIFFELNSEEGWFYDARIMSEKLNSEYIFLWLEDHANISDNDYFNSVVSDMHKTSSDCLLYSAFFFGEQIKSFDNCPTKQTENIIFCDYSLDLHQKRIKNIDNILPINKSKNIKYNKYKASSYIINMPSIFSKKMFLKILENNDLLFKRWSKMTPFDFEKRETDISWLPIRTALPKREFFATIDDNHGYIGYSLIERQHPLIKSILKIQNKIMPNYVEKNDRTGFFINLVKKLKDKANYLYNVYMYLKKKLNE